jgi:histidinol-phosphate aminotransferase
VGLAAADKDIIRGLFKLKDSYNVDRLAEAGARAALLDKKSFKYNIEMVRNNKQYLEESLAALEFEIIPSEANFIFVKNKKIPSKELYAKLKERKILVRYFEGPVQSEYIRISVGKMMDMKTLINEMQSILEA